MSKRSRVRVRRILPGNAKVEKEGTVFCTTVVLELADGRRIDDRICRLDAADLDELPTIGDGETMYAEFDGDLFEAIIRTFGRDPYA